MAKTSPKTGELCSQLISRMRQGQFERCYLLMGEESYYPTLVCNEIISRCIAEEDRDFNQSILYGSETTVDSIISEAMRFPMMAPRQLVVVRDAQAVQNLDKLSSYCASGAAFPLFQAGQKDSPLQGHQREWGRGGVESAERL